MSKCSKKDREFVNAVLAVVLEMDKTMKELGPRQRKKVLKELRELKEDEDG